jgi:hypothetical protein
MGAIRYGILHDAVDASPLWELTWRSTIHEDRRTAEVHPQRTVDEVRPELITLLAEGHVELYELDSSADSALDAAAAGTVVADDGNWVVPVESGRQIAYVVALTDSGDNEYRRLVALHGGA